MRLLLILFLSASSARAAEISVLPGAVNTVRITSGEKTLVVYGDHNGNDGSTDHLLLTHARRDVVGHALPLIGANVAVIAPEAERFFLAEPDKFWAAFPRTRFHDYSQQTTKIVSHPVSVTRWVKDGDTIAWQDTEFQVLTTPGFTRGSVTYVATIGDQKTAFTGDLIYGDGQILDLYSFQDAIPPAQIRGYHGYGARLADLVDSLTKLKEVRPDVLVPARGPVIREPAAAIDRLIDRVRRLYRNYLSTNALHWYFKKDRMEICGRRVLGDDADIPLMPYSNHQKTPDYIFEKGTSRLLVSKTGAGFLLDCGNAAVIDTIQTMIDQGAVTKVEGIFVTHFHDDHTNSVQDAAERFQCPVYATQEYADLLQHPERYHLPAMTDNAIRDVTVVEDGHQMPWHEFNLTFHFFPGQTWYHGALFVRRNDERPVFFIGDAFAPSGLDDYCVQNRNLLHDDTGYLYCLNKLRETKEPFWLINEHIAHVFEFSAQEIDFLESSYRERIAIQKELYPFDDPNYGVDEQWAVLYPRVKEVEPGERFHLEARIMNHSPVARTFTVTVHLPAGLSSPALSEPLQIQLESRQSGVFEFPVAAGTDSGPLLITADIAGTGIPLQRWMDALVVVKPSE